MKKSFLYALLFISTYCFSQSVNNYKGVIVPLKYNFLKTENEYRLATLTKFNLENAGFTAFYNNESIPQEYSDRCSLLYLDVKKESGFLMTKLFIVLKDCKDAIVFQSPIGKSRDKDYQVAYNQALNEAFQSVFALKYKYNGAVNPDKAATVPTVNPVIAPAATVVVDNKDSNILYAQPIAIGFQLVDTEPKVVMKLFTTYAKNFYIAVRGSVEGVLVAKDNQWFFEYHQNDKLISEKINVKF